MQTMAEFIWKPSEVIVPGRKITYEEIPLVEISENEIPVDEELLLHRTKKTTLSNVISAKHDDAGMFHTGVNMADDDPTRASPNCILSGKLPKPWKEEGNFNPVKEGKTVEMVTLEGLAYSQFYNGSHEHANNNMKRVKDDKVKLAKKKSPAVISTFLELESAVYQGRHRAAIFEELDEIVKAYRKQPARNISMLLCLAAGMACNRRYYGAILACRVASFAFEPQCEEGKQSEKFTFMYSIILEMSARTLNVLNRNVNGNKLAIRCMHDVVHEMTATAKRFTAKDRKIVSRSREVILIAGCHNAIVFCCNSIGMFETGNKIASEGLRKIESFYDTSLRRCRIYPDLMLNKGNALLGQYEFVSAIYFYTAAIMNYEACNDMKSIGLEKRIQTAKINMEVAEELKKCDCQRSTVEMT